MRRGKVYAYPELIDGQIIIVKRRPTTRMTLRVNDLTGEVTLNTDYDTSTEEIYDFVQSRRQWIRAALARTEKRRREAPQSDWRFGGWVYIFGSHKQVKPLPEGINANTDPLTAIRWLLTADALYLSSVPASVPDEVSSVRRAILADYVSSLLRIWEPIVGLEVDRITYKQMRTRWGSCRSDLRKINLNLQLSKVPEELVEYILVHELTHLWEHGHGRSFYRRMDGYLPNWRQLRDQIMQPHWMHIT
ncbi:MAG: SprT family zinc-dependent metalloprotease [Actinomycetaceae bacterium]|nr:SprT family zinc-dependent metalloprotease [Actinomycetaceae bacterium]